jgi:hypothetical protein
LGKLSESAVGTIIVVEESVDSHHAHTGGYLLILAVLLCSANLAYAERQFTLLGPWWSWRLLVLAVVHAGIA